MAFTALGLMVSCFLDYRLIHFGAKAEVIDRHIFYEFDFVYGNTGITGVFYFIASVLPLFVSGVKKMKILGSAAVASLLITQIFYSYFIISVWCFFAAIMSVIVYGIMVEMRKDVLQPGFVPAETT